MEVQGWGEDIGRSDKVEGRSVRGERKRDGWKERKEGVYGRKRERERERGVQRLRRGEREVERR